jgi:Family of unknown function (DUF6064)
MPEWWSYSLSDFLLFSPRTYYRLLARYNESVWPAQVLTLSLGFGILVLLLRPRSWQGRAISLVLAALWSWIAWAFLWQRYATINWMARYVVPLFAIEALLLAWLGARQRPMFRVTHDPAGLIGLGLFLLSLLLYPMIARLAERDWAQAEVFGIAPDATVIATLGLLLLTDGRLRWSLFPVPILWSVLTGATLWAMNSPEAWIPLVAALLVPAAAFWRFVRSGVTGWNSSTLEKR